MGNLILLSFQQKTGESIMSAVSCLTLLIRMNKQDLVTLIEAYSDAKSVGNKHLVNVMVAQLERALDSIFDAPAAESTPENG